MGLGKTPIAIACAEELLGCGDISVCLVVCPPSLKYQWADRINQFTDGAGLVVIDGPLKKRKEQYASITDATDYVVIGYPNITSDQRQVRKLAKDMVVLDEITAIKTFKSQRTKAVKRILKSRYRLGLTGTPMENGKPEEIFSIMQWIDEDVLGRAGSLRPDIHPAGTRYEHRQGVQEPSRTARPAEGGDVQEVAGR